MTRIFTSPCVLMLCLAGCADGAKLMKAFKALVEQPLQLML